MNLTKNKLLKIRSKQNESRRRYKKRKLSSRKLSFRKKRSFNLQRRTLKKYLSSPKVKKTSGRKKIRKKRKRGVGHKSRFLVTNVKHGGQPPSAKTAATKIQRAIKRHREFSDFQKSADQQRGSLLRNMGIISEASAIDSGAESSGASSSSLSTMQDFQNFIYAPKKSQRVYPTLQAHMLPGYTLDDKNRWKSPKVYVKYPTTPPTNMVPPWIWMD